MTAREAGGVEGPREDLDHLGGAVRRLGSDQLDAGLRELTHLAALGAYRPVGARDVEEPERRLLGRVAAAHEARDRDRHVGAHRQQRAALVEESVGGRRAVLVAAREDLVVLDGRRRDLAVAAGGEHLDERRLEAAKLAHLVG